MSGAGFKVETGMQLLSRLCKKSELKIFYPSLFSTIPKYGDIIEITTDDVISSLLIDVICEVLMPTEMGGTGIGVLVLSTDGNFNIDHIFKVLSMKLTSCPADKFNEINQECLKNLVLLEIFNSTQFHTVFQNLESIIIKHPNIGLIVLHSLTSFYWSEQGLKIMKMNHYMHNLLQQIYILVKQFKPIILYTRPNCFGTNNDLEEFKKATDLVTNGDKFSIQVFTHKSNFEVILMSKNIQINRKFFILEGIIKWL